MTRINKKVRKIVDRRIIFRSENREKRGGG